MLLLFHVGEKSISRKRCHVHISDRRNGGRDIQGKNLASDHAELNYDLITVLYVRMSSVLETNWQSHPPTLTHTHITSHTPSLFYHVPGAGVPGDAPFIYVLSPSFLPYLEIFSAGRRLSLSRGLGPSGKKHAPSSRSACVLLSIEHSKCTCRVVIQRQQIDSRRRIASTLLRSARFHIRKYAESSSPLSSSTSQTTF